MQFIIEGHADNTLQYTLFDTYITRTFFTHPSLYMYEYSSLVTEYN